ncbi:hypothetical protein ACQY0O_003661 [Thecaphora frezii]
MGVAEGKAIPSAAPPATTSSTPMVLVQREHSPPDWAIDRTVRLQSLNELLHRRSRTDEVIMCAIVDTTKPVGRVGAQPLMDHLKGIKQSCAVCKASMVACCFV